MRILVATPFLAQHFDAGLYWVRALTNLGHSVYLWDYRLQVNIPEVDADASIVFKGEIVTPELLPKPSICYWPDALDRNPGVENRLKGYDKVFHLAKPAPDWLEWLPSGWDPAVHRSLEPPTGNYPSVYIGTCNSGYKKIMVKEIHPDVVFGNNWDNRGRENVPDNVPQGYNVGTAVYLHEFTLAANSAKVLIDIHQAPNAGPNRKLFELIACGFTIVDRVPGVEELLGVELIKSVTFSTSKEARSLIDYYVDHDEERERLWALEKEAIEPYTYENCARRLVECLERVD